MFRSAIREWPSSPLCRDRPARAQRTPTHRYQTQFCPLSSSDGAVDDIATTLLASIDRPRAQAIYNVTDDEPTPPQVVTEYAAGLANLPLPPEIDFETADLSPMARSFYGENKRVRNRLIREELCVDLAYPTYREGLAALVADARA